MKTWCETKIFFRQKRCPDLFSDASPMWKSVQDFPHLEVIPRGVQFLTEAAEPGNLAVLLRKGKLLPKKSHGVMQIDFLKVDVDGCDAWFFESLQKPGT